MPIVIDDGGATGVLPVHRANHWRHASGTRSSRERPDAWSVTAV